MSCVQTKECSKVDADGTLLFNSILILLDRYLAKYKYTSINFNKKLGLRFAYIN